MTRSYIAFERFDETKNPKYLIASWNSNNSILIQTCDVNQTKTHSNFYDNIILERSYKSLTISVNNLIDIIHNFNIASNDDIINNFKTDLIFSYFGIMSGIYITIGKIEAKKIDNNIKISRDDYDGQFSEKIDSLTLSIEEWTEILKNSINIRDDL